MKYVVIDLLIYGIAYLMLCFVFVRKIFYSNKEDTVGSVMSVFKNSIYAAKVNLIMGAICIITGTILFILL